MDKTNAEQAVLQRGTSVGEDTATSHDPCQVHDYPNRLVIGYHRYDPATPNEGRRSK